MGAPGPLATPREGEPPMDDLDKQLLNTLQMNLPLTPRPYAAMGTELGLSETAVFSRVGELKRQNILRQVSAIFDTRKIGYRSSLVAAQVPRELQQDLLLEPRPFLPAAERLGLSEEDLLAHARHMQDDGVMRRFAAVLYHRKAGFKANAMGVWRVPDDRIEEIGFEMGSFAAVSHCYQRPIYPDWPYNVFTMVHG